MRKGDLLISGVRDSVPDGFSVTRAFGKVYAVTERRFDVEIPLQYEKKVIVESKNVEKYLLFFSKEVKIFKRDIQNASNCDTIDTVEELSFFGKLRLPLGVRTVKQVITETVTEAYSPHDAMNAAYYRLSREIELNLPEAQILKKTVTEELTDASYVLHCTVRCIENIGETAEFEFENAG